MNRIYNKHTEFDFGFYKGYELGIVYVFDPSYIEWCITHIDGFYITDLDELKEYNVINTKLNYQYKMIEPSAIYGIDIFSKFQELVDNMDLGDKKYIFNQDTLKTNRKRILVEDEEDEIPFDDDWGSSMGQCNYDESDICEDVSNWNKEFARDNGFFPDGSGWRPDDI